MVMYGIVSRHMMVISQELTHTESSIADKPRNTFRKPSIHSYTQITQLMSHDYINFLVPFYLSYVKKGSLPHVVITLPFLAPRIMSHFFIGPQS